MTPKKTLENDKNKRHDNALTIETKEELDDDVNDDDAMMMMILLLLFFTPLLREEEKRSRVRALFARA